MISLSFTNFATATTPAPSDGKNLGFRFTGLLNSPYSTRPYVSLDGSGTTVTPSTLSSNNYSLDFSVEIDGSIDQYVDPSRTSGGPLSYDTWPSINSGNKDNQFCWSPTTGTAGPLTNFNCIFDNGLGQAFTPTQDGILTNFKMAMTCLSSNGYLDLTAHIYEVDRSVYPYRLEGAPLASKYVEVTGCLNSWSNHTFTNSDFSYPDINFGNLAVNTSTTYAVLFTGEGIAGVTPYGAVNLSRPQTNNCCIANGYIFEDIGSVYFAPGSSKLTNLSKRQLDAIIKLNPSPSNVYKITGYVQSSRSNRNDARLSVARARAVEEYLKQIGAGTYFTVVIETGLTPELNANKYTARRATIYSVIPAVI